MKNRKDIDLVNVSLIIGICVVSIILMGAIVIIISEKAIDIDDSTTSSYYVSTTGDADNEGSLKEPFETIQQGCDVLEPGDTLYILEGTYNEKIFIETSGEKGEMITIQAYEGDRVILDGDGIMGDSDLIYLEDRSYIRIEGLELINSDKGDTPTGILIEGAGTDIEIIDNKIHNIISSKNAHGIAVYGTDGSEAYEDIIISENEVFDCELGQSEAVVVNGNVDGFKITDNKIHDNNNIGIDCIGFEETADTTDQARNGVVSGNTVYNISSEDNPTYDEGSADGIYVDGGRDILIEDNLVYNCDIGIEVASEHEDKVTTGVVVKNNTIYFSDLYGLAVGGADLENGIAKGCEFYNNILYNNTVAIAIQQAEDNRFFDNIIYDDDQLIVGDIGSNLFENNWWYSESGWQGDFEVEIFADPQFIAPEEGDFRQTNGYKGYGITVD